jgi:acylpyruvate hydrolase
VKILTFGARGEERAGILVETPVYDLKRVSSALGKEMLPCDILGLLAAGKASDLPGLYSDLIKARSEGVTMPPGCCWALGDVTVRAPIRRPPKIICLGRNYRDHIEEQHARTPEAPLLFSKAQTSVIGPGEQIVIPRGSTQVDFEGELAFVIGRSLRRADPQEAEEAIFGYCCLNDVTERQAQFSEKQWFRGKSMDTFAPMGPWIVTPDEIGDVLGLNITTKVNTEIMQSDSTGNLIFNPVDIAVFISRAITLEPGDVISTGTPGGVGVFREPQIFLKPGDVVEITIDRIGTLTNPVGGET